MKPEDLQYNWIEKERNIYELAQLIPQCRRSPEEFVEFLASPGGRSKLSIDGEYAVSEDGHQFRICDKVIDFIGKENEDTSSEWGKLNSQFLNYHRSLSVYTLLNGMPITNYLGLKSGLATLKNKTVVDVGAGTGHVHCSFFYYPETIDYYLVDPNLRELHDQLVRVFPKLNQLPLSHLIAYAEALPFRDAFADVVMSLSSIDHFKDFEKFISEAFRILKPGGQLFISSHLDIPQSQENRTSLRHKIFSHTLWERIARYLYFRKHSVGRDDHTYHFVDTQPFEEGMVKAGFEIEESEIFMSNFFVIGKKKG